MSKGRPYKTVVVDGYQVLVGRGDKENDTLTFDVAAPNDIWLHIGGGTPGSHVVVRAVEGEGDPPEAVVLRAAELAAWHSKGRTGGKVEVHVCHVRDVSKPRGFPAGKVMLSNWRKVKVYAKGASSPGGDDPQGG